MPTEHPCQRAARLRSRREEIITGEGVTSTRFGDDMVTFGPANLAALEKEIAAAEAECDRLNGVQAPRRRFAMGVRFRPY
jgi:hypothetical protein